MMQAESGEDLHMALKSCNEIGSARTLLQFLQDLQKIEGQRALSAQHVNMIKNDPTKVFKNWLSTVIVCTEGNYDTKLLEEIAREEPKFTYEHKYMDLLSDIIKELLRENKSNKLQTFGYTLEDPPTNLQPGDNPMNGVKESAVKVNFINLNKQCMITRNWERVYQMLGDRLFAHLYKEYIVFLKTRDDSLVQISGTNIFVYLNDKLGRNLQQAFYDGKAGLPEPTGKVEKVKNLPAHKYNLKNDKDDFTLNIGKGFWDDIVNRNRLFYCAHMNRQNAFFQKHILNAKEPENELTQKIFTNMFGFSRLRKSVKESTLSMITHVIRKQKTFDYNYYLTKNCPLPPDWRAKKVRLLE